jgi:hypothetical protein
MKTAIYIEDGLVQLVITPETEFEKDAMKTLREKRIDAKLFEGTFYDCRGGWVRQTALQSRSRMYGHNDKYDESLILVAREKTESKCAVCDGYEHSAECPNAK